MDKNITRSRSHYSVDHEAIAAMIKDLPQQDNFVLYDLFLALSFANNYNTEEVHASNWRVCPDKVENLWYSLFGTKQMKGCIDELTLLFKGNMEIIRIDRLGYLL